jgi:hypothetical protein
MDWPTVDQLGPSPADDRFVLQPLRPQHNVRDHDAWMSSIEHIRSTPGFEPGTSTDDWPVEMSLESNLRDLEMHAAEFDTGVAYAYSVIDPQTDAVVGCVYVDPDETDAGDGTVGPRAMVRSWVRVDRAELDEPVAISVATWLRGSGAFATVRWPGRPDLTS